jgi:hypothetical protein
MVGGQDHGTLGGDVLAPGPAEAEVDLKERLQDRAHQPVNERICAFVTRTLVQHLVIHGTLAYPFDGRPLQLRSLGTTIDRNRTLRGALCGAVAATVWALAQPLDKQVLGGCYDDVELLGKAVVRSGGWYYPVGLALHAQNGALLGAAYANLARSLPLPAPSRGPFVALVEHLASWPLIALSDRFHPVRDQLPRLAGNRRAFAQATWRHILFGFVLGELERRLNAEPEPASPEAPADFSSNGHGRLEHAVSFVPAS